MQVLSNIHSPSCDILLAGSAYCSRTGRMESWLFSEVVPRYLLSDWDGDLTGLLPCAALINVACQTAVVASDVSPRLFLQEVTSPEHVTWKTARSVLCFQLEWRAEGLTLSRVDWQRINMGLTTTWNYSHGQICVALVINAPLLCFFCFLCSHRWCVRHWEEEDGLHRPPTAGAGNGVPL